MLKLLYFAITLSTLHAVAQTDLLFEKKIDKTVVEMLLEKKFDEKRELKNLDYNDDLFSKVKSLEIKTKFCFHDYFSNNNICSENKNIDKTIFYNDTIISDSYKVKTNIIVLSIMPSSYFSKTINYEDALCLKIKEE